MPEPEVMACTGGCGRRYAVTRPLSEPEPYVCSWCRVKRWEATRKPSAGALKRRAKAYLARRWPERTERREKLIERATGGEA